MLVSVTTLPYLFWNVSVRDPRHNLDHYLVLGCLHSTPLSEHSKYFGRRKRLPLQPLTNLTREDGLFASLQRAVLKPKAMYARKNMWILETTWRLVNKRVSALRKNARDQSLIWRLRCAIAAILKGYQRRRAEEAGKEVETLLGSDPPIHPEA